MNKTYMKKFIPLAIAGLLTLASLSVAAPASATTTLDATGATLDFYNEDGIWMPVGESHLYEDVVTIDETTVDARVTQTILEENTDLEDVDESDSDGIDSFIYVNCDGCDTDLVYSPADNFKGYVEYTIDFFEAGTEIPVILENISFYVRDIDTYQYIEVLDPKSYVFDAATNLSAVYPEENADIAEGNVRIYETNGIESESDDQLHWVQINMESASSITYKIGQDIPAGAFFSVRFFPVTFDNPVLHEAVYTPPVLEKLSKKVFFDGDSAYLKPVWFKKLDKMIAKVPTCATNVSAKIFSGIKKAKSNIKGSKLAKHRAAIVKKFLTKRGFSSTVSLKPNGKGKKAKNNQRFARIVISYDSSTCK
jgi:outer membrane protein OmpA-like peptidoglycan-associated protein